MFELSIANCLIADDNSFELENAKRTVKRRWPKVNIHQATNTEDALWLLLEVRLDLALLDNDIGDGTSLETIPSLLDLLSIPVPPLIMVSGNLDPNLPERALNAGFAGFISKDTFDIHSLSRTVLALRRHPEGLPVFLE